MRKSSFSKDVKVRRAWGSQLQTFFLAYVSPRTKKLWTIDTRKLVVAAVKNFLAYHIGDVADYEFSYGTKEERIQEAKAEEEAEPLTSDEIRRLVKEAKNPRDRALILCLMPGLGVGELIQFTKDWYKYAEAIRNKTIPLRINLVRPKTVRAYWTLLWDDAVETLNDLLQERERKLERKLTDKDYLFVTSYGEPIREESVQDMVRDLADRSGVEKRVENKLTYRVRPHELGRDFLRTTLENLEVQHSIAEFLLGHKVDPLLYNKFARTEEGKDRITKALARARPILNVLTGRGGDVGAKTSYFDHAITFLAMLNNKSTDEVKRLFAEEIMAKAPTTIKDRESFMQAMRAQQRTVTDMDFYRTMSEEQLRPYIQGTALKLRGETFKPKQKVILDTDVEEYLDKGWTYVAPHNGRHAIVSPPSE